MYDFSFLLPPTLIKYDYVGTMETINIELLGYKNIKKLPWAGHWGLMSIFWATWEAEIGRIMAQGANSSQDPISKILRTKWTESEVVEHLLCKHEALSSNPRCRPPQKRVSMDPVTAREQNYKNSVVKTLW
jgi:hypothetical protein